MTPQVFITTYLPAAKASQALNGIPASFTLAQAGLESGWGASQLSQLYHNFFGMQADSGWHGAKTLEPSNEVIKSRVVREQEYFRAYPNDAAGFEDHGNFLIVNPRYKGAFAHTTDARAFATAVAAAGYSTSPTYAQELIEIIDEHNLTQYDNQEQST